MGKGETGSRSVSATSSLPSGGFDLLTDLDEIRTLWKANARPGLWSDDFDLLWAFSGHAQPYLLVGPDAPPLLLQRAPKVDDRCYENLASDWGENTRIPTLDPLWWQGASSALAGSMLGLRLWHTDTTSQQVALPRYDYDERTRYTLPTYSSIDAYLNERLGGERRRRLRKAPPLLLERVSADAIWEQLKAWQLTRNGKEACLVLPQLEKPFSLVRSLLEERGIDRHFLLREVDGTPVAATLGFVYGNTFIYWQDGHAPDALHVGNRKNYAIFKYCFEQGLSVDWLTFDQTFKYDFWRFDSEVRATTTYLFKKTTSTENKLTGQSYSLPNAV